MRLDCRTCGACCISDWNQPAYVDLGPDDLKRLSRRSLALHVVRLSPSGMSYADASMSLRTKQDAKGNCVCIALQGTIGKQSRCGIYARRPRACSEFTVGGKACLDARSQAGMES